MDTTRRFTFRIPEELFAKVEAIAKINHRSVNSEVIIAVQEYLDTHKEKLKSKSE